LEERGVQEEAVNVSRPVPDHLWTYFERAWRTAPERPALHVDGREWSYAELAVRALAVSEAVQRHPSNGPFVGLHAHRSIGAYAGLLGILHAGKAYVPLNPQLPVDRLSTIAGLADLELIVADAARTGSARDLAARRAVPCGIMIAGDATGPDTPHRAGQEAYMLFTSGSTGVPKGVPIRHASVVAYVEHLLARFGVGPEDRFSQTFELTFDLSVHDLFVCWAAGASLHVLPQDQLMAPARFIRDHGITQWFSVPSAAVLMDRMRLLKPGAFPSLRVSAFCGEPLPADLAVKWAAAAPNGRVENLYGPTEATIAITGHVLDPAAPKGRHGILCIGRPFPGARVRVVDADGSDASIGELWLGGPQLSAGYWKDPERTATAFVTAGPDRERYYRTGDQVQRDADGDLYFISRLDDQVKVRGHRIELQEVNQVLKAVSGGAFAYALAHPVRDGIAQGIEAFLPLALQAEGASILEACALRLPEYMVPARLHFTDDIPYTTSGKADLRALRGRLEEPARTGDR
jgi:amino acid adenylation domain-containing protein